MSGKLLANVAKYNDLEVTGRYFIHELNLLYNAVQEIARRRLK